MDDLYAKIGVRRGCSTEGIRARIAKLRDPEVRRRVEIVLLNPNRKRVYDRNHRVLSSIAQLRSRLDLNDAPNWKRTEATDFTEETRSPHYCWSHWEKENSRKSHDETINPLKAEFESLAALVRKFGYNIAIAAFIGAVLLMFWIGPKNPPDEYNDSGSNLTTQSSSRNQDRDQSSSFDQNSTPNSEEKPTFSEPERALPETGSWWDFTSQRRIAPLRISVSFGEHYYIEVERASTGQEVIALFIQSGGTAELRVPTGEYRIKYATGNTWYGRKHLFGPETRYMEADQTFSFRQVGNRVSGHKLELIVQEGGNLSTDQISPEEF